MNQQSTINNQQSTINNQQSTINNQQSTINNQQSTNLLNNKCTICLIENTIKYLYKNIISNKSIVKCKKIEIEYLYPYPT